MADAMREKLREFYQKQYEQSLSVRKTSGNVLLYEKRQEAKLIVARFDIDHLGEQMATNLACLCSSRLATEWADLEMTKLSPDYNKLAGTKPDDVIVPEPNIVPVGTKSAAQHEAELMVRRSAEDSVVPATLFGKSQLPTDSEGMEMPLKDVPYHGNRDFLGILKGSSDPLTRSLTGGDEIPFGKGD